MTGPAVSAAGDGRAGAWRFALDELAATPWKNGCGITREIAVWPIGAGLDDFDWRLSVADVAASGPFSRYPGVDRQIALVDGPGMRLRADDGSFDIRLVVPGMPFSFAGETPVSASILSSPTRDFNVMSRRGRCRAHVVVANDDFVVPGGTHAVLLLPVTGAWSTDAEHDDDAEGLHALHPGEGMLLPCGDGRAWRAVRTGAAGQSQRRPSNGGQIHRCLYVTMVMERA